MPWYFFRGGWRGPGPLVRILWFDWYLTGCGVSWYWGRFVLWWCFLLGACLGPGTLVWDRPCVLNLSRVLSWLASSPSRDPVGFPPWFCFNFPVVYFSIVSRLLVTVTLCSLLGNLAPTDPFV